MKLKKLFYPEIEVSKDSEISRLAMGHGHETPEAAAIEGLEHRGEFPEGEIYKQTDSIVRFSGFVIEKYKVEE